MQTAFQTLLQNAGTRRPKQPKTSATADGAEVACIGPSPVSPCLIDDRSDRDPVAEQ